MNQRFSQKICGIDSYIKDLTELSWAAGFFDGEGYAGFRNASTAYITIVQVDSFVLERFQAAVGGLGYINGPYYRNNGNTHYYNYQAHGGVIYQAIIAKLWPYLSPIKQAQILQPLRKWQGSPARGHK